MNKPKGENSKNPSTSTASLIKDLLAQSLGVDVEDINDDDSLTDDLHMSTSELVDFVESLRERGMDTSSLDLAGIDTVAELTESLISEEYLE